MNIRNNKGITLISEVVAVLLLLIIISIISYSARSSLQIRNLNNMYADIINIQDRVQSYYLKYGLVPTGEEISESVKTAIVESGQTNPNDEEDRYYIVDFSKLDNMVLNNRQTSDEFYFINLRTLTVYYSKGVIITNLNNTVPSESNGKINKIYYTIPSNYENISVINQSEYKDFIKPGEKAEEKNEVYTDGIHEAIIPKGYTVSNIDGETSINDGLIIYDIPDDVDTTGTFWSDINAVHGYKHYIWQSVPTEKCFTMEQWELKDDIGGFLDFSSEYTDSGNDSIQRYNAMKNIVLKNKGYYIKSS